MVAKAVLTNLARAPRQLCTVARVPLKKRTGGLSRYYKSKTQSFAQLSDSLATEWGDSALALAKRLSLTRPPLKYVAAVRASAARAPLRDAEQTRRMEWLQQCAQEACSMMESLSVDCPEEAADRPGSAYAVRIGPDLAFRARQANPSGAGLDDVEPGGRYLRCAGTPNWV